MGVFQWLSRLFKPTPDYYRMQYPDVRDSSGRSHILDNPETFVNCERCGNQILPYARCWIVSETYGGRKMYYCTDCYPSSAAYRKIQEEAERGKKEVQATQDRQFKEEQHLRTEAGSRLTSKYTPLHMASNSEYQYKILWPPVNSPDTVDYMLRQGWEIIDRSEEILYEGGTKKSRWLVFRHKRSS